MEETRYVGSRKATSIGNSTGVSLPKKELREAGVDVDDLQGDNLKCRVEGDEFVVELPIDD